MTGSKGFTLLELLVVMALIGLVLAIGTPQYWNWRAQARYREAAESIALTLREARARALSRNVQQRVEFDVDGNRYRVVEGNRTIGSTAFATVVREWVALHPETALRSGAACNATTDVNLDFNANGTATQSGICIATTGPTVVARFRVDVQLATTGRVAVTRL